MDRYLKTAACCKHFAAYGKYNNIVSLCAAYTNKYNCKHTMYNCKLYNCKHTMYNCKLYNCKYNCKHTMILCSCNVMSIVYDQSMQTSVQSHPYTNSIIIISQTLHMLPDSRIYEIFPNFEDLYTCNTNQKLVKNWTSDGHNAQISNKGV